MTTIHIIVQKTHLGEQDIALSHCINHKQMLTQYSGIACFEETYSGNNCEKGVVCYEVHALLKSGRYLWQPYYY